MTCPPGYVLVLFMTAALTSSPTPNPLAQNFAAIVGGLKQALAAWSARNPAWAPLIVLLWNRLSGITRRFAAIAAHPAARLRPPGRRRARPAPPYRRLPQAKGWLIRLARDSAPFASQLRHLLAQPEMAELLAAAPRALRALRPLCRMLAIPPPTIPPPASPPPTIPPPTIPPPGKASVAPPLSHPRYPTPPNPPASHPPNPAEPCFSAPVRPARRIARQTLR